MSINIYICIYVYINIYVCVYRYVYVCVCVYIYICTKSLQMVTAAMKIKEACSLEEKL